MDTEATEVDATICFPRIKDISAEAEILCVTVASGEALV